MARRAKSSSSPVLLAVVSVLVLVGGGALFFGALNPPPDKVGEASSNSDGEAQASGDTAEVAEVVDPFAGLPDELPPDRSKKNTYDWTDSLSAPIEPGSALDVPAWRATIAVADEAKQVLKEATALRGGGNMTAYRDKAKEAKKLYEEAVQKARAFREELLPITGTDHRDYRRVEVELERWNKNLLALKKSL